jgi:hypothetical protein
VRNLDPTRGPRPGRPSASGPTLLDLGVLAVILLLGAINLPQPFGWDQSIFAIAARRMHEGGLLYRDTWDVKQPGLFLFYWLGGALFGFDEVGVHAFELLMMLAFAWVLQRSLRRVATHAWTASLAPLFAIGFYYAFTGDWHLTQAEGLVGFPLFGAMWLAARAHEPHARPGVRLFLSGLFGGLALMFKLLFLPIVLCFWLVAWVRLARRQPGVGGALGRVALVVAGAGVPFVVAAIYFLATGTFELAWATNLIYPLTIHPPQARFRFHWLVDGLSWFGAGWAPLLGLAGFAVSSIIGRRRDPLVVPLTLWLASGLFVILIQPLSWWQYHYLLLTVPVGVLAARALDQLAEATASDPGLRGGRAAVAVALTLALACSPALGATMLKALDLARDRFALTPATRQAHQVRVSRGGAYGRFLEETAFLARPDALPGDLFVVGNPLIHWLSGREPAIPRCGGILADYASAAEWTDMVAQLRRARPPYVFVSHDEMEHFQKFPERPRALFEMLDSDYRPLSTTLRGSWWVRREEARP